MEAWDSSSQRASDQSKAFPLNVMLYVVYFLSQNNVARRYAEKVGAMSMTKKRLHIFNEYLAQY